MSIEVRDLSHTYAPDTIFSFQALKDVSFDIGPHDFIGIIGHTGSGEIDAYTAFESIAFTYDRYGLCKRSGYHLKRDIHDRDM